MIIVAEDSAPNRTILVHLLKKLGFDVIECSDGEVAFTEAKKAHAAGRKVVAILSDIMMPKVDGLAFLKLIRADEGLGSVPFVLVTAVSDKDYIVQAKALNVNGYILKPVTFQRVTTKLEELLPGKKFPKLAG